MIVRVEENGTPGVRVHVYRAVHPLRGVAPPRPPSVRTSSNSITKDQQQKSSVGRTVGAKASQKPRKDLPNKQINKQASTANKLIGVSSPLRGGGCNRPTVTCISSYYFLLSFLPIFSPFVFVYRFTRLSPVLFSSLQSRFLFPFPLPFDPTVGTANSTSRSTSLCAVAVTSSSH